MLKNIASPDRLAIVAHDAGAANIIISWIQAEPGPYRILLDGPAALIWERQIGRIPNRFSAEELLASADCILTGTGWSSNLEHDYRIAAAVRGIRSIAVIDHWVNYRERFIRDGRELLPDKLWVTDEHAMREARRVLSDVEVEQKPNLYFANQVAVAGAVPELGDMLFVSEPARDKWGRTEEGEFQALDYLEVHRVVIGVPSDTRLRIRPHPSDPPGKYDRWIAAHPRTVLDQSTDIGTALQGARWVVGLQSYALVVALASGRVSISALPPWAPQLCLPHPGLIRLNEVVAEG